ncbi:MULTISPECIES: DUF3180 domain-containing protein [Corynebacterium]|uniref:DUF3180 domain-containing protein n=1 Tax=Corynebacterium TaxID=1716 RepID=UPI000C08666D|nr:MULTISPECIES: DUF3180 domain-containing protein [Corynebacterium]MBF0581834.1 DUF3180 domain-containing protein [Corynebacterium sp. ED61]
MKEMQPTPLSALAWGTGIAVVIAWAATWAFYGSFPPIELTACVFLFVFAVACAVMGWMVRKRIDEGEIGQDSSQMSPLTVAQWMLIGQAVAWIGAVLGGVYAGIGIHVLLNAGHLQAAADDVPGVIGGVVGGVCAAVAGAWLERGCVAPPMDPPAQGRLNA